MEQRSLSKALQGRSLALLDTMVSPHHLFGHPRYVTRTAVLLERWEAGDIARVSDHDHPGRDPTRPAQMGDRKAMWDYEAYLSNFPNLMIVFAGPSSGS